jgi:hypothetical protein
MKHRLFAALGAMALFLFSLPAAAQYLPEWHQGDLSKKGARIAVQGEKLSRDTTLLLLNSVGGDEMVERWEKYTKQRGWGIGLTSGGYTLAAAGLCYGGVYFLAGLVASIFVAFGGQEAIDQLWSEMGPRVYVGAAATVGGLAVGTTGAVLLGTANKKMKNMVGTCNEAGTPVPGTAPTPELTFGPAPSGVGLVLHF